MALGPCPECKGQVSSSATACPHCGHPLGTSAEVRPRAAEAEAPGVRHAELRPPALVAGAPPGGPEQVVWEGGPSLRLLTTDLVVSVSFAIFLIVATIFGLPGALRTLAGF